MIPSELSLSIAAKLAGCSTDRFRRDVYEQVRAPSGRVDRCALEMYRGGRIPPEDWCNADLALAAGQRRRQAEYRARLREAGRDVTA